jgi:hypothetical protein
LSTIPKKSSMNIIDLSILVGVDDWVRILLNQFHSYHYQKMPDLLVGHFLVGFVFVTIKLINA